MDSIVQYETALNSGKFVVIAHGSEAETLQAREILNRTHRETSREHQPLRHSPEPALVGA